jgi:hypothetical protein
MDRIYNVTTGAELPIAAVKERSELVKIYGAIKEKCQTNIENAFDEVSRQVGYVVTTTIPIDLELEQGKVKHISMGAENLKGTIFEKAMIKALKPLTDEPLPVIGTKYTLVVLWKEALMLTMVKPGDYSPYEMVQVLKDAFSHLGERTATIKEQVLTSAIDQVYPELNFAQRLANSKATSNTIQSNAILSNLQSAQRRFL